VKSRRAVEHIYLNGAYLNCDEMARYRRAYPLQFRSCSENWAFNSSEHCSGCKRKSVNSERSGFANRMMRDEWY
jgi:hypothetical protein